MKAGHVAHCLLLFCSTLMPAAASQTAGDVRGWLQSMVESVKTLNYRGTFVLLHDNQLETMEIVHSVDAGGERERLVSLNGAAREVVRDDASVICVAPDARSISVSRRAGGSGFRAVYSMDVDALSAFYDFHLLNRARVAGRETQAVAILPKDAYRYGYRIFLDTKKALPLKTDMLDDKGTVVSQIMFTSIEVDDEVTEVTEGNLDGREYYQWVQREPGRVRSEPETDEWSLEGLPQGYSIRLRAQMPASDGKGPPVSHFVVSDGLASLSLYIEASGADSALIGASRMGAVNAFGRQLAGHQITAVGAVPALTVEKIAGAVRRSAD